MPGTEFHKAMANDGFDLFVLMHPEDVIQLDFILDKYFNYGSNS